MKSTAEFDSLWIEKKAGWNQYIAVGRCVCDVERVTSQVKIV